jgi:DNA helicase IV
VISLRTSTQRHTTDAVSSHPDLPAERAYLARAYEHLAAMRARTEAVADIAEGAAQAVDSAIAQAHLRHRLRSLDVDVPGLSFGRLDHEDGQRWYVGRRHVEDEQGEPVVVDWRAEVSTPFYRATAADPLDLVRRRRFLMTEQHLDDLFDEVFDDPDSVHAARHGGIPDPLLAELERSRSGEMRDIVATIAAEQDLVIRSPLDTCLVVQGGPGTGKTAVGLHRAAFLLYEHRALLDQQGVLVIGPNPVFLRYIAQVLPSLGETATRQTTIERLVGGRVVGFDPPARARLLGDARMATVLARACARQLRPPTDDLVIATAWGRVTLGADDVAAAVGEIVERGTAFSTGRVALRTRLQRLARRQHVAQRGEEGASPDAFDAALRASDDFQRAVSRIWPSLSAPALVKRVLTSRAALARAADGLLGADEQQLLLRKGGRRLDDEPWTLAELVLVDEAQDLVNGPPRAYGHVVVDEAQDLSAMELRAVARRCPSGSMTVLGDLAQASAPAAQASWESAVDHLGSPPTAVIEELELGYRVPAPILRVANRLLASVAPHVRPSRSVREEGAEPAFATCPAGELGPAVAAVVADQAARWGSVGVIAPDDHRDVVAASLDDHDAVLLVSPPEAKGLEFDAVVVVGPAAFPGRLLYIALTRAVQELVVVSPDDQPPPPELLGREVRA